MWCKLIYVYWYAYVCLNVYAYVYVNTNVYIYICFYILRYTYIDLYRDGHTRVYIHSDIYDVGLNSYSCHFDVCLKCRTLLLYFAAMRANAKSRHKFRVGHSVERKALQRRIEGGQLVRRQSSPGPPANTPVDMLDYV